MNYVDIVVLRKRFFEAPFVRGIYGDFNVDDITMIQKDLNDDGLGDDLDRFVASHMGSLGCKVRCEAIWDPGETQAGSNPADILVIPGYFYLRPIEILETLDEEKLYE